MKIEAIQLENIRSHVKSTVPFTRGFNCLVGALGCGKSSVLYAVDFALFGEPLGRSFAYLLREGTDSGRIVVQFTQGGRTYKIVRGIRRRGQSISQDFELLKLFEGETIIASMKGDAVAEQLKSITGLDRDLWREIVWVRQEHLKELLDAAPREKQKRLDEMFGLSDYELAWSKIAEYQRSYEAERKHLEKDPDVIGKEKLATEYDRLAGEFTGLELELQSAQEKLSATRQCVELADVKLKKLEEKHVLFEELKREEAGLLANIMNSEDVIHSLERKSRDKKTIIENLRQREGFMEDQIAEWHHKLQGAEIPFSPEVELKSVLQEFEERVGSLKAEQEVLYRALQTDQKRVSQLSSRNGNQCPLCLQPLKDEYKTAMLDKFEQDNSERQKRIEKLQKEVSGLQKKKFLLSEAVSSLNTLAAKTQDLHIRLIEEGKYLAEILSEFDGKQARRDELHRRLESLRCEITRFDIGDLEAAREQSRKVLRECLSLEADLRAKESRKKDLAKRIDEVKERIDFAQQKFERKETINKLIEIVGAIRDAFRGIQPRLRTEFVKILRNFVQQVLDGLVGEGVALNITIDDTYTPTVMSESGLEREVSNLSGGERTLLAFAYRLGLGQLIMQSRTGHGLSVLLLDEPTESLGREDGSIDRLAEAISRFKAIEQIIAVTHSEEFAEKAEHVITVEKEDGVSRVSIEH